MKDLERVNKFLGMTISQDHTGISLDMADYIQSAIQQSSISTVQTFPTPITDIKPLFDLSSPSVPDITYYQSIIGQLLFVANAG